MPISLCSLGMAAIEVGFQRHGAVGAAAADQALGGAGDVVHVRVQLGQQFADAVFQRLGRGAFVAAAIQAHRGVVAYAQQRVADVAQEHVVVVGVGAVDGVGQPEILPHHDAVAVAGVVEGVVAGLSHPVADHGEVHVAVVADGDVVFARAVAQHGFGEAPVAAARDEAAAVDEDLQRAAVFGVGELADAGVEAFRIGHRSPAVAAQ